MSQAGKKVQRQEPEPEALPEKPKHQYNPMENAPKGVRILLLKPDGSEVEAYYYATRQFRGGVWAHHGFWTEAMGNRTPIEWEPQGWRWYSLEMP